MHHLVYIKEVTFQSIYCYITGKTNMVNKRVMTSNFIQNTKSNQLVKYDTNLAFQIYI